VITNQAIRPDPWLASKKTKPGPGGFLDVAAHAAGQGQPPIFTPVSRLEIGAGQAAIVGGIVSEPARKAACEGFMAVETCVEMAPQVGQQAHHARIVRLEGGQASWGQQMAGEQERDGFLDAR
jgi:hypothetical protein